MLDVVAEGEQIGRERDLRPPPPDGRARHFPEGAAPASGGPAGPRYLAEITAPNC